MTTIAPGGRSSLMRLPRALREAVDQAVAEGATIEEITALIREQGGVCSQAAVGRYVKNLRDLMRRQEESDREIEARVRALRERAHGDAGLLLIEAMRTLMVETVAELDRREEPATPEELSRLTLALSRIERADSLRLQREQAAAKAAKAAKAAADAGRPAHGPGGAKKKGLSPETVAMMQEAIEGRPRRAPVASAPVDPWSPEAAPDSHLIPHDPAKKRSASESCALPRDGPRA